MLISFFTLLATVFQDDRLGLPDADINNFSGNLKNLIFALAAIAALYFLVLSGFKYVTSGGNAEQTKKASQTIIYASVGLFIILMSYVIMTWVLKIGSAT